jgi:hypothetical protein
MIALIEEESNVLSDRAKWPAPIGVEELLALKLAMASKEGMPVDSDNCFIRISEEWVNMEECLAECFIAVFHHYKVKDKEGLAIFVLAPTWESAHQLWIAFNGEKPLSERLEYIEAYNE